ncbi:MAG TPA: flagellar hook capping FlgD N-terminal domain-containing protein [bacterium]|nr:flagellar hook capping FlgD N-terminal domain-containing protein [bacterium]
MNVADVIQSTSSPNSQSASALGGKESMGKQDFLKLLTVQLQHQNPLSPMKGQEFSSQLAQFSQVEQLENINSGLKSSNEIDLQLTRSITNSLSTTMVGKEAKVSGNKVLANQDGTGEVSFKLQEYADNVKIHINDEQGDRVKTITKKALPGGEHTFSLEESGLDFSSQTYSFEVKATNGEQTVPANPMMIGMVNKVRFNQNGSFIILDGAEASFSSVLEIGNPESIK